MKKLRLDLDHLAVESFPTARGAEERGTVAAHAASLPGCTLQPSFGNTACELTWHCSNIPGVC
ncbi:MAG TPA: hypothetical protein VFT45_16745 [Longimicrobium sp.]|nr:hypothetical protein [Longimicrobium sp.]